MLGRRPTLILLWTAVGLLLATTGAVTDEDDTADTIIVRRGQTAEITGHLASGIRQHCPAEEDCQVSILGNNSRRCGYLQPERFNTSDDVQVIFSHFGCGEPHLPLEFRILRPHGEVRFATLEVTVAPSDHPLSHILRSIQVVPLRTEDEAGIGKATFNLSVTFYTMVTWQECSYSLSFYPFYLQVPEHGKLVGDLVNERIPCGYEPSSPIQYGTNQTNANDYLLLILWDKKSAATTPLHGIIDIKLRDSQYNHKHTTHSVNFTVTQTGYNFVPSHLLIPPPHSLGSLSAKTRLYSSSTSCGRFVTPHHPRSVEDDSHTLITTDDLRSNAVAFHQLFANCSEIDYHLKAYDVAGVLLWKMVVKVTPRSLQAVPTLHYVAQAGSTLNITSMLLRLSESFGDQCTFHVLHGVENGDLQWTTAHGSNISALGQSWSHPLEPGTLWYTAGRQNGALVWEVTCVSQPFIRNVTAFVTVIGKDTLPLIPGMQKSELHVYEGYATQLGSRLFHWTDPDTDDFAASYGIPMTDLSVLVVDVSNAADTILPLADLGVQVNAESPSSGYVMFSHADWLNGRVWITASHNTTDEKLLIFVDLSQSGYHVLFFNIHVHSSPPPGPLTSFKKATAVTVVLDTNLPLTLNDTSPTNHIIWETYLKARVQGPVSATPIPIVYHIRIPPQYGYICVEVSGTCKEPAQNFTQQDIELFSVRYVLRNSSEVDAFSFYLDGSDGQAHWFVIRTAQSVVTRDPCGNSRLYIPAPIGSRTILNVDSFQQSLSEVTALELVVPPRHGNLSVSSFAVSALLAGSVTYTAHSSSQMACSDDAAFAVSTNSTYSIIVLHFALMTATSTPIHVDVQIQPKSIYKDSSSALTESNVYITGVPFCPEVVRVQITREPLFGTLQTSGGSLNEGCSFSQDQLDSNEVSYVSSRTTSFNDSVSFTVTVPLIGDKLNITTEEFTMNISYSNSAQPTGQLTVAPQLPITRFDVAGESFYGVSFEINKTMNYSLPEGADPKGYIVKFQPRTVRKGSFIGQLQGDEGQFFWPYPFTTNPLIYQINTTSLSENESSLQIDILSYILPFGLQTNTSVHVYWSGVSFLSSRVQLEAKQERQEIPIEIQRVGSISEVSQVMIRSTYADKAIILECPPGQEYCIISNSSDGVTTITFSPHTDRVVLSLIVSLGPEWKGGSELVALQLMGVTNAVPLPPLDQMTIELLEYSWIQFSEPLNSSDAFGPQMDCHYTVSIEEGPVTLPFLITRQGNLAERTGVICYTETPLNSLPHFGNTNFEPRPIASSSSIVYFEPNAREAICEVKILNDDDPEGTEKFTVRLQALSGSRSHVNATANSVCVFITDRDPTSEVFFAQTEIREREPDQETIAVDVFIKRKLLVDYGERTTVYYRTVPGTATEYEDFIPDDSAVDFNGYQPEAKITLHILPGREWFKEESFSVEITGVEQGVIGDSRGVVTVIIEGGEVVMGFTEQEYFFLETEDDLVFPVSRHGNLSIEIFFYCVLQYVVSEQFSNATLGESYQSSKILHTQSFSSEQESSDCILRIADDAQGQDTLQIALVLAGDHIEQYVRFDVRSAVIRIQDREDAEIIGFSGRTVTVAEPVTNFDIDYKPLNASSATIVREGDTTMETTVGVHIYSPAADTAQLGQDFKLLTDTIVFRPGEVQASIPVRILATPQKWTETLYFGLELYPTSGDRWAKRKTVIDAPYSKLTVHIEDHHIRGPFFPDLPRISSTEPPGIIASQEETLSSLFPLDCITPCDLNWTGDQDYTEFCRNESIDTMKTQFVWEFSRDGGKTFFELNLTTPLASARVQMLDPIFMSPGQHYRCKVIAGSRHGLSNHARISKPVKVSPTAGRSCPDVLPGIDVELTPLGQASQTNFTSTDVVEMVITLNHIDNMFPLVSTSSFSRDLVGAQRSTYSRKRHKCSNFVLREIHSFWGSSAPNPLLHMYQSLPAFCKLEFRSWHRITDLVQECGEEVEASHSGSARKYTLAFYVAYFNATYTHLHDSFTTNIAKTVSVQPPSAESVSPMLAAAATSSLEAILEPLDLAVNTDMSLEVILRSTIFFSAGSQFVAERFGYESSVKSDAEDIYISLSLVATSDISMENTTQLWLMKSRGSVSTDFSGNYTATLVCEPQEYHVAPLPCLQEGKGHQFQFRIDRSSSSGSSRPAYHFSPLTVLSLTGMAEIGDTFDTDDTVNATLEVTEDQIVQSDHALKVKCVLLCRDPSSSSMDTPAGCTTVYMSDRTIAGWNLSMNTHDRLKVSFAFKIDSYQVGCWNLVVNYTFVHTSGDGHHASLGESSVSRKVTITSEATPSPSSNPNTNAANPPFEHTEAFFVVVLLIFGIVCIFGIVTLTLVFWKWRTKHLVAAPPLYTNARVFRQSTTKTCVTPSGKMAAAVTVEMTEISCSSSRSDHLHSALDLVGEGRARTTQTDGRVRDIKFCSLPQLCPEADNGTVDNSTSRCKGRQYKVAVPYIRPTEQPLHEEDLTEHIERTLAASALSPAQSNVAIIQTDL